MESIQRNRNFYLIEGVIFAILGILAIALPGLFTLTVELFIGWLFVIGGIVLGYRTITAKGAPGFWFSLFSAIIYIIIGLLLVFNPLAGVLTLTALLIILFLIQGFAQIALGLEMKAHSAWGWYVFSGIISLLLAVIIWSGWPGTAVWAIGLLVGINLLFAGITQIAIALSK